jgi:hypothetical protein
MNTEITKTNVKGVDSGKPKGLWDYDVVMGGVD